MKSNLNTMGFKYQQTIGKIHLGDFAYLSDPDCGISDKRNCTMDVVPGDYLVFITRTESKTFNGTISNIYAIHKDFYKNYKGRPKNDKEMLVCEVDSGYCGIFDGKYFEDYHDETGVDDDWYDEKIQDMPEINITDGFGAVCFSGIGCGVYKVYAEYTQGKAFALRVNFL